MNTMTKRVRNVSIAAAVALSPMVGVMSASDAFAAPSPSATALDDALQLSWDDANYSATTTETFFGTPVTVPGDSASRTISVKNMGPSDGVLTAKIVNVKIVDADKADVHHNTDHVDPDGAGTMYKGAGDQGDWYSDLDLSWAMGDSNGHNNFRKLNAAGETQIYQAKLAKNASIPVKMTYSIPLEATSGNKANVQKREASFDVIFTISGDTPSTPPPTTPATTPPTTPATTPPTTPATTPATKPPTHTVTVTTKPGHTPSSTSKPGVKIDTGNQFDMKKAVLGALGGLALIGGGLFAMRRTNDKGRFSR